MPYSYPTLSSTKTSFIVEKTEGNYCPVRTTNIECFKRIILGNLAMFSKISLKKISPSALLIYEQVSVAL